MQNGFGWRCVGSEVKYDLGTLRTERCGIAQKIIKHLHNPTILSNHHDWLLRLDQNKLVIGKTLPPQLDEIFQQCGKIECFAILADDFGIHPAGLRNIGNQPVKAAHIL